MGVFKSFIIYIKNRGVSARFHEENQLTGMLNIMSLITAFGAFLLFILAISFTSDYVYMGIVLMVACMFLGIILLNHFHKIHEARLYFAAIVPFWHVITMLSIGGYFGQDIGCCATITISYILYDHHKSLRNRLILFNLIIFIVPTVYISFNAPIFGIRDYPFDELVTFLCCIGWMSILYFNREETSKNYIKSLAKKNEQLEEKTSDLERFAYIASHDLKSPLNNISNFLKLMDKDLERENYNNLNTYLEYTRNSAIQMNELIDGVSSISTNGGEEDCSEWKDINLNETLKKVMNNLNQELIEKNGTVDKENDLPTLRCNESDFIILFQNLIQNGLKYNQSEAPNIRIVNKTSGKLFNIEFTDNGIGISEEHFEEIFEYFKRLHNQKLYKGTGLGLGLCKKIVHKYGGNLTVRSKVNEYATFTISIPNHHEHCDEELEEVLAAQI